METWGLWALGTADPAGTGDRGWLDICDEGPMGSEASDDADLAVSDAQSQGGRDSQVHVGSRCRSGGLGSKGRQAAAPRLRPHYPENNVM